MNPSSPSNDLRNTSIEDNLDRLLSDYFKSKMKQPWPAAPATPNRLAVSEPSSLMAARVPAISISETPRNHPTANATSHDGGNKSRYTLAVSVAVLLGTCWALSNSFQPGERISPSSSSSPRLNVFPDAGASDPAVLKEIRKDKAEQGNQTPAAPKIQLP